ncbi:MAG: hypothetical protein M1815_004866 [Lichina confinis]|nr:MAG: hypothetical protein M1815_004866 [Lichina confinis]
MGTKLPTRYNGEEEYIVAVQGQQKTQLWRSIRYLFSLPRRPSASRQHHRGYKAGRFKLANYLWLRLLKSGQGYQMPLKGPAQVTAVPTEDSDMLDADNTEHIETTRPTTDPTFEVVPPEISGKPTGDDDSEWQATGGDDTGNEATDDDAAEDGVVDDSNADPTEDEAVKKTGDEAGKKSGGDAVKKAGDETGCRPKAVKVMSMSDNM